MHAAEVLKLYEGAASDPRQDDRLGAARSDAWQDLELGSGRAVDVDATRLHEEVRGRRDDPAIEGSDREQEDPSGPDRQQPPRPRYQRRICDSIRASTPRSGGFELAPWTQTSTSSTSNSSAPLVSHPCSLANIGA